MMAALLAGLGTVADDVEDDAEDEGAQIPSSPDYDKVDEDNQSKMRRVPRLTVHECAQDLLTYVCQCSPNCFDTIRMLPSAARAMSNARISLVQAGHRRSTSLLFKMIHSGRVRLHNKGHRFRITFSIRGVEVCKVAWFWYHDLDQRDSRVRRVLASIRRGDNNWVPRRASSGSGSGRKGIAGRAAQEWLKEYVTEFSDQIPNRCVFRVEDVENIELHNNYKREQELLMVCVV